MMKIQKANLTLKRISAYLIIIILLMLVDYAGFFESANNYLYDLFFRIRGNTQCANEILLVNIDDKTLEKLGRWPIKRNNYARLIEDTLNSRIIIFDIIMAELSPDDNILGLAIKKHGRVLLPVHIEGTNKIKYPSIPIPPVYQGHIHIEQDVDGIVRSVYHTLTLSNISIPSITSLAYEYITERPFKREKFGDDLKLSVDKEKILQSDKMRINYTGGHGTFNSVSFIDVIEGIYPHSFFKDKILIVGLTASGTYDVILTPFLKDRRGMAGIEVQANILNTLIFNNSIKDIGLSLKWIIVFMLSACSFTVFMHITEKKAAIWALLLILCILLFSYLFHTKLYVWIAPVIYCISIFFVFIITYIFKFDDAARILEEAYMTLESRLRWGIGEKSSTPVRKGLLSFLTKKGIYNQAKVLTKVGRQLNFEKELVDRALLSNIHGVLLFDDKGNNLIVNDFAKNIFKEVGIETNSLPLFIGSLMPHLLEKIDDDLMENLYNEDAQKTFTLAMANKEKRFYKMDFSIFHVDTMRYILVLITDITKIKELELLKSHIISVVSHELKSPMTSIMGFSEILSKNLTGKMQNFAGIIHRESERLVRFLNTFLDITRIEEGRQPLRITWVNLVEVVKEVANALKPIGDANKIDISTDTPHEMADIMVDRDLTKQCIFNLVENAIKYSPPERDVIIRLKEEDNNVRIDIIDHGYGIKEEDLGRIFDKFFRSTSEKTKNIKGSGLGLTFVKEAVELQGGQLTLSSRYNEGSTFSIIFPKKQIRG
ncbi:MAG TPA: CHASE2 domain-containing protein [Syntrophorhabdaceae bacterium]|nr:CHASE2 domain-containing protein [Syntrophorhabdaceae bacterium]